MRWAYPGEAVLLLIDTRDQRPPPNPGRRPDHAWVRRAIPFVIAIVCLVFAVLLPPLPAYLLTVATLALICLGVAKFLPDMDGLNKHRQ